MTLHQPRRFEAVHCTLTIHSPVPGVVVVALSGRDVGELGDAPFGELQKHLDARSPIELFIDARDGQGATVDVSASWAAWLGAHRGQLRQICMLTRSPFIQLSADFVRKFAELGDTMRITSDPKAFDEALAAATSDTTDRTAE